MAPQRRRRRLHPLLFWIPGVLLLAASGFLLWTVGANLMGWAILVACFVVLGLLGRVLMWAGAVVSGVVGVALVAGVFVIAINTRGEAAPGITFSFNWGLQSPTTTSELVVTGTATSVIAADTTGTVQATQTPTATAPVGQSTVAPSPSRAAATSQPGASPTGTATQPAVTATPTPSAPSATATATLTTAPPSSTATATTPPKPSPTATASASTAKVQSVVVGIIPQGDDRVRYPVDDSMPFQPNGKEIDVSAEIKGVNRQVAVSFRFVYLKSGELSDVAGATISADKVVSGRWIRGSSLRPEGDYKVVALLDGKEAGSTTFRVKATPMG